MAFEELNDEGSDTVFHVKNTVSKSLHDHYTHRDTVGLRVSHLDMVSYACSSRSWLSARLSVAT